MDEKIPMPTGEERQAAIRRIVELSGVEQRARRSVPLSVVFFGVEDCLFLPVLAALLCLIPGAVIARFDSVAPLLVNLALDALLAVQCYERLVLTYRLFGRRPPWARAWGAWALALALALWSACSLVPYAQDLPLVLEGKWSTGIVTLEMEEDTAWNNAMAQLGRACGISVGASVAVELTD